MTRRYPKSICSVSMPVVFISIVSLFFPFVNILPLFFPVQFLGKNLWIVIPIFLIMGLYIRSLFKGGQFILDRFDLGLLTIAVIGFLIHSARDLIYSESRSILDFRYIVSSIVFLLVFKRFVQGEKNLGLAAWAVLLACLTQAVIGILHAHFFSYINIDFENLELILDAERTRENGTLGASVYANFILCGMFLIVAKRSEVSSIGYAIFENLAILAMLYAVTLSGSRYPTACAFFLAFIFLSRSISNWRQMIVLTGLVGILTYLFLFGKEGVELLSIFRFSGDSGGRFEKLTLPLMLLSDRFSHFLIGVPSALTETAFTADGLDISDNSYMLMALQFGVSFTIGWFTFFIRLLSRNVLDWFSFFFMVYVLIGLGLTNGILWEPWVYVAILSSTILYKRLPLNAPDFRIARRPEATVYSFEEAPQRQC